MINSMLVSRFVPFILLACLLAGCSQRIVDFTAISTKNIDWSKAASFERSKNRVEGTDKVHWIVVLPTGRPHMKEAIDRALENTPGSVALLDGVVKTRFWYIPYVYGRQYITVEGTPLIDPSLVDGDSGGNHWGTSLAKDGAGFQSAAIPENESQLFRAVLTPDVSAKK